jgi:phage tail-like protein
MAGFHVNVHRVDPYKNFKFQVMLDNRVVPGILRVSPLWRRTEIVHWREGGSIGGIRTTPGLTGFDPITLERGVTHDTTFEDWAALSFNPMDDTRMSLRNYRKDMVVNLLNQQGTIVLRYMVYRCWVSEYQPLPQLDANDNEVAVERLVIAHEGFARDTEITEPQET